MKREIIFRGKRLDNCEWVYGDLEYSRITEAVFIHTYDPITKEYARQFRVEPNTVGQFTGLTDKKGTKIFEGDIIKRKLFTWRVFYFDRCAGFYISNDMTTSPSSITPITNDIIRRYEVIGNIYDNPSLLEEN